MTDEVEGDILRALLGRLEENEFSVPLKIAMPGVKFDVTNDVFLDASVHFTGVVQAAVGDAGFNRYTGFLRVGVDDMHGSGVLRAMRIASEVVSLFRRGTSIAVGSRTVRIVLPPTISDPLETSGRVRIPVTVRWQSDNPNVT